MIYIDTMKLNKTVLIRLNEEWYLHLQKQAEKRGPGTKITDVIREAIYKRYPLPPDRDKKD